MMFKAPICFLGMVVLVFSAFGAGCASYRKSLESRGYAAADIEEVEKQQVEYYNELFYYQQGIGKHNTAQAAATQAKVGGIYCACVKKLADQCRRSPAGLSATDRSVWVKGNAAEGALNAIGAAGKPEPEMCK